MPGETTLTCRFGDHGRWYRDGERLHALRLSKTGIHATKRLETADHQTRTHKQHQRQRDLRRHQRAC